MAREVYARGELLAEKEGMVLRTPYALSGTDIRCDPRLASWVGTRYIFSTTGHIADATAHFLCNVRCRHRVVSVLRILYAMCGTDALLHAVRRSLEGRGREGEREAWGGEREDERGDGADRESERGS